VPAGDLERLEKAIARGDDVNYLTAGDWNAGMAAAIEGHTEALKMVIDAGVNLEQRSEPNQWNALMFAAFQGHDECLKLLIDAGVDLNKQCKDSRTALMMTAQMGKTSTFKLLLDAGADPLIKGDSGRDAALWASMHGEGAKEILDILTEAGANPDGWLPRESPEAHAARIKAKKEAKEKAELDEEKEL
jgi:ankyrin repeat protein